ncbi:MAG: hypothetical protein ACT4PP_12655 [Sporichthyaceae bacterium]
MSEREPAGPAPSASVLPRSAGPLALLGAAYTVLALAAAGRASVQLAEDPGRAPFAYGLTAVAALVYLAGAVLLRRPAARSRAAARVVCAVELLGVLMVGTLSLIAEDLFADQSVWSSYGAGYAFVPLVLPPAALWFLRTGSTS